MDPWRVNESDIADRPTVGKVATDAAAGPDERINSVELQEAIHKGNTSDDSYESQIDQALERGKKAHEGEFYLVVLFKKERLLQNVVRQYFFTRISCPTPEFDQTVYRYHPKSDQLEFIWTVPDWGTVEKLCHYRADIHPDQQELADYAYRFKHGLLDRECAKLNKELA